MGSSDLVARVTALDTMLEATDTAAAHAEDRLGLLWYSDFDIRILTSRDDALLQSEHDENIKGRLAAECVLRSLEAPVLSCIAPGMLALGDVPRGQLV